MSRRTCAFTLVEVLLTLTIMSLVMGGLGTTLLLASKAIPTGETQLGGTVQAVRGVQDMTADFVTLRSVISRSGNGILITVPDRDNDGLPESISYSWSGAPGSPLTRSYNGKTAATIVDAVREFQLTYDLRESTTITPDVNESSEQVLARYVATTGLSDFAVDKNSWIGQYFKPTLPADATAWKITRVALRLRANGTNTGLARVQLRLPTAGNVPSAVVLDDADVIENTLSTNYLDSEYRFTHASGISPTSGVCIVLQSGSATAACDARFQLDGHTGADANLVTTSNAGSVWTSNATKSMLFSVFGTYNTPSQVTTKVYSLRGIRIKLRAGTDQSAPAESTVRTLNLPEVPG